MKTLFITGATGGLGRLCVQALSACGRWTVFAAGRNPGKLEALGRLPRVVPVKMDILAEASVREAREFVRERAGSLDAIAHMAGASSFVSLVEGKGLAELSALMELNLIGAARVNQAFFDLLARDGSDGVLPGRSAGRIIHCSSEAGWMKAQPFAGPYYASKHALEAYNDSLRRELMFLGIPVIVLRPGSFDTELTRSVQDDFCRVEAGTALYRDVLSRMKPLMLWELTRRNDPERFVRVFMRALEAPRPRISYKVGTGPLVLALEVLPDPWVDALYRLVYRLRGLSRRK